eukprot:7291201-Prymnesium_polylepis.1
MHCIAFSRLYSSQPRPGVPGVGSPETAPEARRRRQDQVLQLWRGGPFLLELPRPEEGIEGSQEAERGDRGVTRDA